MFLAAIVVGLLTAYYFGLRAGGFAAAATLGCAVLALVFPALTLLAYGALACLVAGVCWYGPRLGRPHVPASLVRTVRHGVREVRRRLGLRRPRR